MNSDSTEFKLPIVHSKPFLDERESLAVQEVLASGHLESGEWVSKFEHKVAAITEKKYAVATSNGFGAIHLALDALDIRENDEVIIPSYTCSALYHPIRLMGATPIICDIEKNSFHLSIKEVEKKLTPKTKAIIIPHTFGFIVDISAFKKFGIPIIEDCAHALGFRAYNAVVGSVGDITICSFYASKLLCAGDGGMVLVNNEEYFNKIKSRVCYSGQVGLSERAYNYRYTNINAALGLVQMEKLQEILKKRVIISEIYDQFFQNVDSIGIGFKEKNNSCFYRYPVSISNRDEVKKKLYKRGIFTGFGVLENMHTLISSLSGNDFKESIQRAQEILSIPIYPSLTVSEVEFVANSLIEIVQE